MGEKKSRNWSESNLVEEMDSRETEYDENKRERKKAMELRMWQREKAKELR